MAYNKINMTGKYILDGKVAVEEPDLVKWGQWMELHENKIVKQEKIVVGKRIWKVSTVFLGLDHNHLRFAEDEPKPILFETMIFNHSKSKKRSQLRCEFLERYETWEEAEAGHEEAKQKLEWLTACRRKRKKMLRKKIPDKVERDWLAGHVRGFKKVCEAENESE